MKERSAMITAHGWTLMLDGGGLGGWGEAANFIFVHHHYYHHHTISTRKTRVANGRELRGVIGVWEVIKDGVFEWHGGILFVFFAFVVLAYHSG